MSKVNGIPTSHEFKKHIGRTGLSKKFKQADQEILNILATLQNAEYWRSINTAGALRPLRMVRASCISWISANQPPAKRAARPKITDLCDAVHLRISTLLEYLYSTSKNAHETKKNKDLMSAVHDQIRLRRGGGVGKSLSDHYGVERNTGSHIPKPSGVQAKARWTQARAAGSSLGFEAWVEHVLVPQSEEDPFGVYFQSGRVNGMHLKSLKTQRVKYCTPDERDGYIITMQAGAVKDFSGSMYHTGSKETAFSGPGWAIYVIDFDNNFYSESHIVNEFHHSSFLAGGPVQGAGEIAVDQGRVVAVTNKTGHYQAGERELERTLELLQAGGVDLKSIKVNDPFRAKGKWFSGSAAFSAGGKLADLPSQVETSPPPKVPH